MSNYSGFAITCPTTQEEWQAHFSKEGAGFYDNDANIRYGCRTIGMERAQYIRDYVAYCMSRLAWSITTVATNFMQKPLDTD